MEPTIELGDQVRIEACARARAGDIVLLDSQGRISGSQNEWPSGQKTGPTSDGYVLHRVVFCIPATGWLIHIGDSEACLVPGVAHVSQLIGRAALPRRLARPRALWAGFLRVARAAARRALSR